jgi:peptidoglycan/xylan/chitin deacetylase (PgdA/CDA1 family)
MINRLLKAIISIVFFVGYKFYSAIYYISKKKSPSTFVVLTYHAISNDQQHKFARQMEMLKNYHPIFPDTKTDLDAGRHYVAVTFDDGFENVVENALPELVKRNIPATLFIPTGYLGKKPGWIINLKNNKINEPVMNVVRLQSLQTDLIRIGSHSVNHRSLTQLHEEEAMLELVDSKMYLETLLHGKITSFSFPYGAYNNIVLELAKKAGYKNVFCSWPLFPPSMMNGFLIGRTPASPDETALEFRLKIMGAYQWLSIGISLKRKVYTVLRINNFTGYAFEKKTWG